MKKIIILIFLLLICGCKKEQILKCTYTNTDEKLKYTEEVKYKVYYNKKEYVTKIEKEEKYYSELKERINYFNDYRKIYYDELNSLYNGYTYTVDTNDKNVNVNILIDLSKVDLKKMISNNYLDKYYVVKNHLSLGGLKLYYKEKGVKCDI